MTDHPITPPPELVEQWYSNTPLDRGRTLAAYAARWGAEQRGAANESELQKARDEELEASLEWLCQAGYNEAPYRLRAARRPKPPTLKEQALEILEINNDVDSQLSAVHYSILRRALEQLPDAL
ncbi:MAG: hypothetical protein MUP90_13325 [Gammaproteobacteria bacterium]|nr:hypothetical protein [Gammaproteobacteria bacterium]